MMVMVKWHKPMCHWQGALARLMLVDLVAKRRNDVVTIGKLAFAMNLPNKSSKTTRTWWSLHEEHGPPQIPCPQNMVQCTSILRQRWLKLGFMWPPQSVLPHMWDSKKVLDVEGFGWRITSGPTWNKVILGCLTFLTICWVLIILLRQITEWLDGCSIEKIYGLTCIDVLLYK